jgi:chaperonin GroES
VAVLAVVSGFFGGLFSADSRACPAAYNGCGQPGAQREQPVSRSRDAAVSPVLPRHPRKPTNSMNESVEPLGMSILIRKDESRQKTRGGIVLPDAAEIPTITGRVVEISVQVANDPDYPIKKYDKVLFHPKRSIPVDFESDNLLYVVPVEDVVAVFRRLPAGTSPVNSPDEPESQDEYDDGLE